LPAARKKALAMICFAALAMSMAEVIGGAGRPRLLRASPELATSGAGCRAADRIPAAVAGPATSEALAARPAMPPGRAAARPGPASDSKPAGMKSTVIRTIRAAHRRDNIISPSAKQVTPRERRWSGDIQFYY
jgi:hypothetical protein